jgi:hypothetical protein
MSGGVQDCARQNQREVESGSHHCRLGALDNSYYEELNYDTLKTAWTTVVGITPNREG